MGIIKKIVGGITVVGASGLSFIVYDVNRFRVYEDQSFSEAFRHYSSVRGLGLLGSIYKKKLEAATKDVDKAQLDFLFDVLKENADTDYSREFKLGEMSSIAEFQAGHPLTRYNHYARPVARMLSGETGVLTRDLPSVFAVTSGTSGTANIIPMLSKQTKIFFLDGISVLYKCMTDAFPETRMLRRDLKVFFSPNWRQSVNNIRIGPNSASPERSKDSLHIYSTPPAAYNVKDEPQALYLYLLYALKDRQLGMIEANFSSLVYNALVSMEAHLPQLIKDIEKGKIDPDLKIDPEVRAELEKDLKPDPTRAEEIRVAAVGGREGMAKRIWPDLHMILGADTGTFQLYGDKLREGYCKGVELYSPIYAASEGLLGVNIWPGASPSRYLLHPRTQFFELIPEADMEQDQPQTKLLSQVKEGGTYELVITNPSCLYRYRFGDVVRVVGHHNQCPVVEFLYRKGQFLNVRGEKTSEAAFYQALQVAAPSLGQRLKDYCCLESVLLDGVEGLPQELSTSSPCYHIFIETEPLAGDQTTSLKGEKGSGPAAASLEAALCEASYPYASFRAKGSIGPLKVHFVQPGAFAGLRAFTLRESEATSNQYKVPRVLKRQDAAKFIISQISS